jgi:hypothetical protein
MGLVLKTLVAFCIGAGAMYGLQTLWLSSIKQQLSTRQVAMPQVQQMQMKPIPTIDPAQFRAALYPKIDPNIGKDAWRGTLNQQINQSINAGRMVPLPPRHFTGMPR